MDGESTAAFETYLRSGERLIWTGRPRQGLMFGARDIFMVPFSLVWAGIAFFGIGAGLFHGQAIGPLLLVGPVFMVVGVYFVIGRFLIDAWARSRTIYGLTNERALVLRRLFGEELLAARTGGEVRMSRRANGRGTIEFGSSVGLFSGLSNWRQSMALWHPSLANDVRFIGIDDVAEVYRLAQRAG